MNGEFNIETSAAQDKIGIVVYNFSPSFSETFYCSNSDCKVGKNPYIPSYSKEYVYHTLLGDNEKVDLSVPIKVGSTQPINILKKLIPMFCISLLVEEHVLSLMSIK